MSREMADAPVPFFQSGEQRLIKLRKKLERLFEGLHLVHDVVIVSVSALSTQNADYDSEVAHVLVRCGADEIHEQLMSLSHIVEQLGGETEYTRKGASEGESPSDEKAESSQHVTEAVDNE